MPGYLLLKQYAIIIILSVIVVLGVGLFYVNIIGQYDNDKAWVVHTETVIKNSNDLLQLFTDAETGVRAYCATNDEVFLQYYNAALPRIPAKIKELQKLIADNRLQVRRMDTIAQLADVQLSDLAKYVNDAHVSQLSRIALDVIFNADKSNMAKLRVLNKNLDNTEAILFAARQKKASTTLGQTYISVIAGIAVFLLILSVLSRYIFKAIKRLQSTERDVTYKNSELNKQAEELQAQHEELLSANEELYYKTGLLQAAAKRELETVQDRLKLALDSAQIGTFDMDLVADTLEWDKKCRVLFGINHEDKVTYEGDFVEGLHPDDRTRVLEIIRKVFTKSETDGDYDVEYRTIGKADGRVRWLRAKGKAYFDENEKPVRFIGTVIEVTEQKQDEERKNDFIGMVSHELKTPLTSLKAYVQMLNQRAKKQGDEFTSGALSKAENQIQKMVAMITGFLNVNRLESGKIHLDKQRFNLEKLIAELIEEIAHFTPGHVISLKPCDPVIINADKDKIASVITNLLSNAVKYSPKGKHIEVFCQAKGTHVQVSVSDEGMGIKPQDLDRVFERFSRIETKHTQHVSGFGIGLYLCSEIINRHDGRIWVESQSGVGSTFYFTLPLS